MGISLCLHVHMWVCESGCLSQAEKKKEKDRKRNQACERKGDGCYDKLISVNFSLSFVCLRQFSLTEAIQVRATPSQAAAEMTGAICLLRKQITIQLSLMSAQQRPV